MFTCDNGKAMVGYRNAMSQPFGQYEMTPDCFRLQNNVFPGEIRLTSKIDSNPVPGHLRLRPHFGKKANVQRNGINPSV